MQSSKGNSIGGTKVSKRRKDGRRHGPKEKERDGGGHGPKEKQRDLYVVLDDWSVGYSIRKIDLSIGETGQQLIHRVHSLPSASFKFEALRGYPNHFAAYDSKLLAMQPIGSKYENSFIDGFLIYDVLTRSFVAGPRQSSDPINPIYIPVGDKLFALSAGSFQLLYPLPHDESDCEGFVWKWHTLPEPPFLHEHVTCYGVHLDGRIYVTIGGGTPATFSFDTTVSMLKGDGSWKKHAQCNMLFKGRAYFVAELGAWVGLCKCRQLIGGIDVVSQNIDGSQHDQALKLCEELSCFSAAELPIGTTLVSMGGGSKFCLLQYIYKSEDELSGSSTGKENEEQQDCKPVMRLITFSLKYDKNGGLTISTRPQIQHYSVPSQVTSSMLETPVAFWM